MKAGKHGVGLYPLKRTKAIFYFRIMALALLAALVAPGCTASYEPTAYERSAPPPVRQDGEGRYMDDAFSAERMVIYNARLRLVVKRPDSANRSLSAIAKQYGGYPQTLGTHYSTIRVEASKLEAALKAIGQLGRVAEQTISGEDITEVYRDNDIRLANAEKSRDRYLELLKQANNVTEVLAIEKELERLNGEIDRLKGYKNRAEHLVQYATIHVNLQEKVKPGPVGYVFAGLYHAVKWLFVRN